jgi:Plasma-membrane choline transporter
MSYLKAGKSVFELFQNRGWEAIIADDLVGNTLFLISIIVGALMGCVGLIVEATGDLFEDTGGNAQLIAFVLGFVIGLVITSILMSTIASGVNAVIVLFAEGPNEFQQNHPELSNKMRQVWSEVYPGSV